MKRYCLVQDESSHWYVVPADKKDEWFETLIEEVGVPKWAHEVGGAYTAVEFERPTIFGEEVELTKKARR